MSTQPICCASCGRQTSSTNPRGWAAVIRHGLPVGWTCTDCPRAGRDGEPIRRLVREVTRNGQTTHKVTYRVMVDRCPDPATGKRRQLSKVYEVEHDDKGRPLYSKTLADARAGVIELRAKIAKIDAQEALHGPPSASPDMTVDQLADLWLESKRGEVRDVTREGYGHALKPIRRRLGARKVQSIGHGDVVALRRWLSESGGQNGRPLGSHAARASLVAFKACLAHAVHVLRVIGEDPARGVKIKAMQAATGSRAELERWTPTELVAFTVHADSDRLAAAWRLACLGLRREEVLGLDWSAVNFDTGTITVRQTRVAVSSETDVRRWMLGPVKAAASERTLSPDAVQLGTMHALRQLWMAQGRPDAGLVALDAAGQPVLPRTFTERFQALARDARVPVIRLHSTRHTVAYLLHDAGVPPVKAAAFLGHTLAVHLSTYLFAREEDVDVAGAALGAVLARAAAE